MVQWTPIFNSMFWLRLAVILLGVVWMRHGMTALMIHMRDVDVERENQGIYRLTTFSNGVQTSIQLHGETQGELARPF